MNEEVGLEEWGTKKEEGVLFLSHQRYGVLMTNIGYLSPSSSPSHQRYGVHEM